MTETQLDMVQALLDEQAACFQAIARQMRLEVWCAEHGLPRPMRERPAVQFLPPPNPTSPFST